jgi:hypothetical protein
MNSLPGISRLCLLFDSKLLCDLLINNSEYLHFVLGSFLLHLSKKHLNLIVNIYQQLKEHSWDYSICLEKEQINQSESKKNQIL